MSTALEIIIRGTPAPGGSKTAIHLKKNGRYQCYPDGRAILLYKDDAKGNAEWKAAVAAAGRMAMIRAGLNTPLDGLLVAMVDFFMPRPKFHYVANNPARPLRDDAPERPTSSPDATKLWRSTEDALNGVAWVDDSRIVKYTAEKFYTPRGHADGAVVVVTRLNGGTLFEAERREQVAIGAIAPEGRAAT